MVYIVNGCFIGYVKEQTMSLTQRHNLYAVPNIDAQKKNEEKKRGEEIVIIVSDKCISVRFARTLQEKVCTAY